MKKVRSFGILVLVLLVVMSQSAFGGIIATHIADGQRAILNKSISVNIDPANTNWIAWHNLTFPTNRAGVDYVGSYSWIAVDDYFDLKITNPLGTSQTVRMDYNDAWGLSTGPQAVIFGTAADTPNVARWGASWSPTSAGTSSNPKIFDEAGAFNSLFTTAGDYTFTFLSGNTGSTVVGYPNMYLLVDVVPEPTTIGLLVLGGVIFVSKRQF
ncbi:MAG: PEP-CTERM sorting domain-containing protein [Phycisphaerae bacterium]|nr:PEP-CTERM sorting domain-containing protein [Phycisphaerae bacterium]